MQMEHVAHTETEEGITLKIILDAHGDTESPLEDDRAVIFAVLHRRYINPAKTLTKFDADDNSYDFNSVEGIAKFEADNAGPDSEWAVFPLFMYDHSGTVYQCSTGGNPFSCPWDSGRVGIIAMLKAEVGPDPLKSAQATCETYTDWANGNIYGFVVEDEDGEELDACWGFIGDSDGYVLAEGRDILTYHVNKKREADAAALIEENTRIAAALEASRPDMYGEATP